MYSEVNHRIDYYWNIHSYTNEYIRFADEKAGIITLIQTGVIAAMYSTGLHLSCGPWMLCKEPSLYHTILGSVTAIGLFGLLAGLYCSIRAIAPSLLHEFSPAFRASVLNLPPSNLPEGPIYFGQVATFATKDAYISYLEKLDSELQLKSIASHIHVLATIAQRKYYWISLSIILGSFGGVFALIAFFVASWPD
jgi:hypothetical protein